MWACNTLIIAEILTSAVVEAKLYEPTTVVIVSQELCDLSLIQKPSYLVTNVSSAFLHIFGAT
jgi:uncharacterized protein YqiB (DUF1249 family)